MSLRSLSATIRESCKSDENREVDESAGYALVLEVLSVAGGIPIVGILPSTLAFVLCLFMLVIHIVLFPVIWLIGKCMDDDYLARRNLRLSFYFGVYALANIMTLTAICFCHELLIPWMNSSIRQGAHA